MEDAFNEKDIHALSELHHRYFYKLLHSKYEDKFPKIKGLTPLEMGVLGTLSENPNAMLKEISGKLAISKSTLTSVVDRLERRNYVHRVISLKDRRSFELELTEEGQLAQQQHVDSENGLYKKVLNSMDSSDDVQKLLELLRKIVEDF